MKVESEELKMRASRRPATLLLSSGRSRCRWNAKYGNGSYWTLSVCKMPLGAGSDCRKESGGHFGQNAECMHQQIQPEEKVFAL
jgi:hypothetical protein